ncbi:MAG TPA: heavy-metal-associated domain-containing protein [Thermoanaerobaculia bacterium]|nr:heavy-metal-associated domain-containing protein [Thermoanaerobaculia bacterium]
MTTHEVNDMTCGHCVGTSTRVVQAVDCDARVDADLGKRQVTVSPRSATAQDLQGAIEGAGDTPVPVRVPMPVQATGPEPGAAQRGGCCGCC